MKKNNSEAKEVKRTDKAWKGPLTIGMDLGDRTSRYCVLDGTGEVVKEGSVATTRPAMKALFGAMKKCRIAMEVGAHSPWVSRLLKAMGHEVIVANPRQLKVITESSRKDDKVDAEMLARVDPKLLRPIRHRGEEAQMDLMTIRARAALVEARTGLVNAARGFSKSVGERLASCDTDQMGVEKLAELPVSLQMVLKPLVEQVSQLTASIKKYDRELEQIARVKYPETRFNVNLSNLALFAALSLSAALISCGSAPEKKAETAPPAAEQTPVKNNAPLLLPENLVSAIVRQNHLLDKDVLPGGTIGDYSENGKTYQLFIIETASAQDAAILLLDFKKTLEDPNYIAYMGGYFGTDKGKPVYVFAKQQYLAGVVGLGRDSADLLARKLAVRLR